MQLKFTRLKSTLNSTPYIGDLAFWIVNRMMGTWKKNPAYWISKIVKFNVIQVVKIGSNDGKTGDPLYMLLHRRSNWKALFVEPVPYLFDRLKKNYSDSNRFIFENAAISDGKSDQFFYVDESADQSLKGLPRTFDQLGSFDKQNIMRCLPELGPFIRQAEVPCISLPYLFEKHQINKIDILHIDSEGYDYKILSQFDLKIFQPKVILIEHIHLSKDEKKSTISFLDAMYHIYDLGIDMLAVRNESIKALQSMLHTLRECRVTYSQAS